MKRQRYSKEQLNYFEAKAKYETISDEIETAIKESGANNLII